MSTGPNWTSLPRGRGWAMGSTFALPEATALTSRLRPGAGIVSNTAVVAKDRRCRQCGHSRAGKGQSAAAYGRGLSLSPERPLMPMVFLLSPLGSLVIVLNIPLYLTLTLFRGLYNPYRQRLELSQPCSPFLLLCLLLQTPGNCLDPNRPGASSR